MLWSTHQAKNYTCLFNTIQLHVTEIVSDYIDSWLFYSNFREWHYSCTPRIFDLGDEIRNSSKSKFSRKVVILAVWVIAFSWNFDTTIDNYLAILCQILTDWEPFTRVSIFLSPVTFFTFDMSICRSLSPFFSMSRIHD